MIYYPTIILGEDIMIYYHLIIGAIIGASLMKMWYLRQINRIFVRVRDHGDLDIQLAELEILRELL